MATTTMVELFNGFIDAIMLKTMNKDKKALRCVDFGYYFDTEGNHTGLDEQFEARREMFYIITSLNALQLNSGHKFLNIGSGIGYFSTVAGLLLGRNGVNHGIEVNERFIDLAREKLTEFNLNSSAIDHHDFCEPIFIHGNACELLPTGYYDRVYCEAVVAHEKLAFMKSLIKISGILIMPLGGSLWKVIRQDEHQYMSKAISAVIENSFSNLIVPKHGSTKIVTFPPVKLLTLQELCRHNIRSSIRQNLQNARSEEDCEEDEIRDYRVNKFSRCLREKIYSLSIPTQIKHFLNYNRID